jgi:hypothetical protein
MQTALLLLVAALGLYGVHRLLLRLEAAGYLYYKNHRASPGTLSAAMNSVQGVLEPGRRHVAEVRREQHVQVDKDPKGKPAGAGGGLTVEK